ncbi:MAG: beta strand repeat-containing protein, partial [Pirellula sp.]
ENLSGSSYADTLTGDSNSNVIDGGGGNDTLQGGLGNDFLIGGAGTDTVVFTGNWSGYTITQGTDSYGNYYQVSDNTASRDGVDRVYGVESFQFADGTRSAVRAVLDTAVAVEAGGVNNGTAGTNPTGNVISNDAGNIMAGSITVSGVAAGTAGMASGSVGSTVAGSYGTITISSVGAYTYTVDNSNASVQALATSANTLTDVFTYTIQDASGATSTSQISVTIQGANDALVITSDGGWSVAGDFVVENTTAVTTVVGLDVDSSTTLTYSIVGGADSSKFSINSSTGALVFVTAPDFEAPTDSGANNVYNVTVQVSDGTATATQAISVIVTDNSTGGTVVASYDTYINAGATSTNYGTSTSMIVDRSGGDPGNQRALIQFALSDIPVGATITSAQMRLNATAVTGSMPVEVYRVTSTWTEAGATWTSMNAAYNATAITSITAASTGTHVFDITSAVSGWYAGTFSNFGVMLGSTGTGTTTVTYSSDESANAPQLVLAFTVPNVAPVISSGGGGVTATVSVAENSTAVTTVTATDSDTPAQTLTHLIVGGADASLFTINSSTGALAFTSGRNFEAPTDSDGNNIYQVIVQTSDSYGLYDQQTISVTVTNVNEAPSAVSNSATAVEAGGVSNGTAGTNPTGNVLTNDTDVDAGDTKTVTGVAVGTVGSASTNVGVSVAGTYGSISISSAGAYTYTVDNNNATVQALRTSANTLNDVFTYTMRDTAGLTSTTQITVTIQGSNDAPSDLATTGLTIAENSANGTTVGTLTRTDADSGDTAAYSLVDSAGGRFAINGSTGVVTVADGTRLNFEATTSHNITVRVTDTAGAAYDEVFAVTVTYVNESPTAVSDTATAVEAGGVVNGTAGTNPTGNVLTNDTDVDAGDTKTVVGVAAGTVGSASTNVGTSVTGTYGAITISAAGGYTYTVDNNNAAVQALRTTANTLNDVFTYTMSDAAGLASTTQFTVTIQGANDTPTSALVNGAVAAYNFENGSGNAPSLVAGGATMSVGGAVTYSTTAGRVTGSSGMLFTTDADSTTTPVSLSSIPNLSTTNAFTFGAWVRFDALSATQGWERIFDFGGGQANNNFVLCRRSNSNDLFVSAYSGTTISGTITATGALSGQVGNWMHVAATVDSSNVATLYVNGASVGSVNLTGAINYSTWTSNRIGGSNWTADRLFRGAMDDIVLFDRALTSSEVSRLAASVNSASIAENSANGTN